MRVLAPGDWSWIDSGIKDAMKRIEKLSEHGLPDPEGANLWRVLEALNHARAELWAGKERCEYLQKSKTT